MIFGYPYLRKASYWGMGWDRVYGWSWCETMPFGIVLPETTQDGGLDVFSCWTGIKPVSPACDMFSRIFIYCTCSVCPCKWLPNALNKLRKFHLGLNWNDIIHRSTFKRYENHLIFCWDEIQVLQSIPARSDYAFQFLVIVPTSHWYLFLTTQ